MAKIVYTINQNWPAKIWLFDNNKTSGKLERIRQQD